MAGLFIVFFGVWLTGVTGIIYGIAVLVRGRIPIIPNPFLKGYKARLAGILIVCVIIALLVLFHFWLKDFLEINDR